MTPKYLHHWRHDWVRQMASLPAGPARKEELRQMLVDATSAVVASSPDFDCMRSALDAFDAVDRCGLSIGMRVRTIDGIGIATPWAGLTGVVVGFPAAGNVRVQFDDGRFVTCAPSDVAPLPTEDGK